MNTSNIDIQTIKEIMEDKIRHNYIEKFLGKPIINEEKLRVLSIIINQSTLSDKVKDAFLTSCVLVQVALDTHEQVPVNFQSDISKDEKITNQLRVLAGDYYSGLYYLLLADIEDLNMIQVLSTAIKEINENKMKLYYMENNSIEEYIQIMQRIEFLLIQYIAEHVDDDSLNAISSEWIIIKRLIQEKEDIEKNRESQFINTWSPSFSNHSIFMKQLDTIILNKTLALKELITRTSDEQSEYKNYVLNRLSDIINSNISIVEEG